jgi:hypothetical protein
MNGVVYARNPPSMAQMSFVVLRPLLVGVLCALAGSACGSSGPNVGGPDGGAQDGSYVVPNTESCTGAKTTCLFGTVSIRDFQAQPVASEVTLYKVFPHGNPSVSTVPLARDGTFAFSDVPAWGHYYIHAQATFGTGSSARSVASIVGSFTVPGDNAPIAISIHPVYLEILQQTAAGMPNSLAWASAHLYDPTTAAELSDATVALAVSGKTYPMPYTTNANGTMSFYATFPAGTTGGTSFKMTTLASAFGSTPLSWTLVGEPATFQGAILSPTSTASANEPLQVTWQAVPSASYSVTELFEQKGTGFETTYISPETNAPNVTTETIPATALPSTGAYLLNESYANATCPASADGCVYNVSTAAVNLTVN